MDSDPGGNILASTALASLDAILSAEPSPDPALYSAALQRLCALRNGLAAPGGDRKQLGRVNAVISIVMAAEFPLGAVPWAELHAARAWLT